MSKTALVLVDFQNDYFPTFSGAKWPLSETETAAQNAAILLDHVREEGLPVVHVRHESLAENAPFFQVGTEGADIHHSLKPLPDEAVVVKHKVNSFLDTNLNSILKDQGVIRLVIAGAMSHMCIDAIVRAASDLGYECVLVHDACATRDLEFNGVKVPAEHVHAAFMAALTSYCSLKSSEAEMSMI
ncbi:cysteine hydrolase family protein [Litoribrevibacter euphylliae]|uniref:Cysteine hydrolase family protein n=1 Tax=Litoribrevibacter euphylliae TaxID=1834034 RepID=A0ABV7HCG3_9GAMM